MNKISLSQLETARKNPTAFAKSLTTPNGSSPRFSKMMAWQYSVYHYHKEKGNLSKATTYFESIFQRRFADNASNERQRKEYVEKLIEYAENDSKNKLTYVEHRKRISISLTSKIRMGGELPLIKMNNQGGYSVYFFHRLRTPWETELRFPIVQHFVASTLYNVSLSEVEVGVYSLPLGEHQQRHYTEREVIDAVKELQSIGTAVSLAL
jgi:hypothetical protein